MKKALKGISLLLAMCLMIATFAACGKEKAENPSETTPPVSDSAPSTNAEGKSGSSTEGSQNPTKTNQSEPAKKPSTSNELIDAYNKALSAKNLTCTSVKQKVTEGTLGTKDKVVVDLSKDSEAEFRKTFERDDKNGASLPVLSASDVKNATVSGNTVTITLNDHSTNASLSNSVNGYVNIVDNARVNELVTVIAEATNVSGVKVNSTDYNLTGGKIVAVFNDDFTKLVSVSVTYKQAVNAKMSWTLLTILADLKYDVTTEYKG